MSVHCPSKILPPSRQDKKKNKIGYQRRETETISCYIDRILKCEHLSMTHDSRKYLYVDTLRRPLVGQYRFKMKFPCLANKHLPGKFASVFLERNDIASSLKIQEKNNIYDSNGNHFCLSV